MSGSSAFAATKKPTPTPTVKTTAKATAKPTAKATTKALVGFASHSHWPVWDLAPCFCRA